MQEQIFDFNFGKNQLSYAIRIQLIITNSNVLMIRLKSLLLFGAVMCMFSLSAQDMHFSYFQFSPITLNPAATGSFEGTFRIGGIYRDQWGTAGDSFSDGFKQPSFYVDAPLIRGFDKNDWVGVGLGFFRDSRGPFRLKDDGGLLSVAYHFGLGEDANNVLAVGGQFGQISRKTNIFEDRDFRDGLINGVSQEDKNERSKSYSTWNAGVQFTANPNDQTNFKFGVGVLHLTTSDFSLAQGRQDQDMTINATAELTRVLSPRMRISPALYYQTSGTGNRMALQAILGTLLNPSKGLVLNYGAGFQLAEAADVELFVGADIRDLKVGFSYDVNVSGSNEITNSFGSFEIGVSYIAKIYKKPNTKPVIFCPRF